VGGTAAVWSSNLVTFRLF